MTKSTLRAAALVALVVLAGCAAGPSGIDDRPARSPAVGTTDGGGTGPGDATGDGGTVRFYVSDEPNAIDDFRHLNVTVSRVGFERAGDGGGWVEYGVENRTVDLTRLRGDNATMLSEFRVPNGSYTKVFAHVSGIEATLTSGEEVRVKLPSERLQLNKPFEVEPDATVEFVFDIAVHRAGKSGKYVLRPVIGQSGTDVPIDSIDEDEAERDGDDAREADDERQDDGERDDDGDDRDDEDDGADGRVLHAAFVGNVTPGETATVRVTRDGTPVENATVVANGEPVGTTDADGLLSFGVPPDAEELSVEVAVGDAEVELEAEFEPGDDG